MPLQPGHKLAHYEIVEPIGKGGMGEVYRARDGKLGREVAIKVLPDEFAENEERLARFKREAKALASLNHPGIAAIHGLEESKGTHYLVLELVPGETLAERISRGPIPVEEALDIAAKIAVALEEAHEKGIIHRDLKPANIKQTEDGKIKVLDFGLAKVFQEATPEADSSMSPTLTRDATRVGVILGTAAYMSPEQAKGKRVDKRTDIFAFGAVLYEMLTGNQAFPGEDVSEILASVIKLEPDWSALPPETPAAARQLMERCLRKEGKARLRDIGDARFAFEDTAASAQAPTVPRSNGRDKLLLVGGTAVLVALTTALTVWNVSRQEPANAIVRFSVSLPARDCEPRDWRCRLQDVIALSPDGKNLIYGSTAEGVRQLYRRPINQLRVLAIPGTEGAQQPFFSPDGVWIGFFADGQLKKVRAAGGAPETICEVTGRGPNFLGASWGDNDTIVLGSDNVGLGQVRASGGVVEAVTTLDLDGGEYAHGWPQVLPGTSSVLFNVLTEGDNPNRSRIVVFSPETGERKLLIDGGSNPRYVSTGHIIYITEGSLRAVAFDLDRLEVTGDPVTMFDDAYMEYESSRGGFFDLTESGTLAYIAGTARPEILDNVVVWVDREGREDTIDPELHATRAVRISPDGTKLAFSVRNDIWIWDLARRARSRLTFDRMENAHPLWSLDGSRLVFRSTRDGYGLYWTAADGTGDVERLTRSRAAQNPQDWTPDGTQLFVYDRDDPEEQASTFILTLNPERTYRPLLKTRFYETGANLSPDGNWLAYTSNESGQREIYVRPFPDIDTGKWQVSTGGGTVSVWSPDGSELFYWNRTEFMRVTMDTSSTLTAGVPEVLFSGPYFYGYSTPAYDIAPDGSRFLMLKPIEDESETPPQINVVLNWFEELTARVPTDN